MKKVDRKKNAFTLIELMAVIIILGVTLSVAVPMITRAVRKSKLELMENQEDILSLVGKDYFLSNRGELPKDIGDTRNVTISMLVEEGYTKEVKDYKKEVCNSDNSYVEAVKLDKGKYVYHTYLECNNYTTGDLWSEWSTWGDVEPVGGDNVEIETVLYYNYEEAMDYWSNWSDWEEISESDRVKGVSEIIDSESQYRYRDQQWKWNNGGGREYAEGYYVSAPSGYPNQDSSQTSFTSWVVGSATGSSTKEVQYKDKNMEVSNGLYYSYDNVPSSYPNRYSYDGTVSNWIYKYYSEGYNGYSYTYDSNRTGALSIRTRSLNWGGWNTIGSGSVTTSGTRQIQFRDKQYRYSRYKYCCESSTNKGECENHYSSSYYSSPTLSQCNTVCGSLQKMLCTYTSMTSKYGDYDRNEGNVEGVAISTSYGRKSWEDVYYGYEGYSGTMSYDNARREIQYRDLNTYSGYSDWVSQGSGTHVVSDVKDIAYKDKLYKYYYLDWGPWSATQTSGTYTTSDTRSVQYRDKTYKYYKDTLETCGLESQYYSESPDPLCGYKDEEDTIFTDWVSGTTLPVSKDYRTIERQVRNKIRDWSGEALPSYLPLEEFEFVMGKNLEEIEALEDIKYVTKTMYRYRTKVY